MADMFEEGIKAAGKAEYIGALPESTYMGGATIRDKMRGALRNLGMDNRGINALIGDMRDEDLIDNIGILDLTPAMLPAVVQEGSRSIKQGDYLQGGLDLGFSALEMAPFAAVVAKPLKSFLRNLGKKSMAKEAPVDLSRRKALGAIAAAPIAATALSDIPVGKIIDDVLPTTKIVEDAVIKPKIVGSNLFKNIKQEAKFAADMYNVKTGKNLTPNEIIKRDMAEYLYFAEEGDFNPAMLEKATRNLKSNPVYEVLDDIGYEPGPDELEILKKHMGDADGYEYGSSGGDELTQRFFEEENPDKLFKNEIGNLTYNNDDIIDWVKSKGIQKTKYYKDLVKAGNAD